MLKDFAPAPQGGKVRQARKLRKAMTLPEGLVWRLLRSRPFGLKFRRQHPTGAFVLDFYCIDARLAVEIDGLAHDMGNRPARDIERDRWLRLHGIATLRVPTSAVLHDAGAAADRIIDVARSRLPLHHPASPGGPPPRDKLGEE